MNFFSNLRIIDLSTVLAGPSVATFFAELGAEVLKIENPKNKDVTRSWKLASEDTESEVSAYFSSINYGKKYEFLSLSSPEDFHKVKEYIEKADILISNFKKGDDFKFALTDEDLKKINPTLIHGKINGYGSDSDRVAYDLILQAESGFMSMNGTQDSGPVKMPVALIDVLAAHHLKEALLLALLQQTKEKKAITVEVSLYEAAICSLVNQASNFLMEGHIPQRIGSLHPNIAPYGEIFSSSEGKLLTFAIGSQTHFEKLCSFLNCSHLLIDSRFKENQFRVINRKILFEFLFEQVKLKTAKEIESWALTNFIPCGFIKNLKEVFSEEKAKNKVIPELINGIDTKRVSQIAFKWNTK